MSCRLAVSGRVVRKVTKRTVESESVRSGLRSETIGPISRGTKVDRVVIVVTTKRDTGPIGDRQKSRDAAILAGVSAIMAVRPLSPS